MPIANCVVAADITVPSSGECLIARWAANAGVPADEMTVNFISSVSQFGKAYAVVATLYLPDLWPANKATALQLGLAKALSEYLGVDNAQLIVITQPVASGQVVEAGRQVAW